MTANDRLKVVRDVYGAYESYEATRTDGSRFRNTEIFGFDGDKISRVEVYFGWDVG